MTRWADNVVAMGGVVLGSGSTAELKRLRVSPAVQGRGLSRAMVQALEARAVSLDARTIFADTTVQQLPAQGLYRSMGYRISRRYKAGRFVVLRFRKALKKSDAMKTGAAGQD